MYTCIVFYVIFCILVCGWGFGRREDDGFIRLKKEVDVGSFWLEIDGGR